MKKISAVIITQNEERNIERCILSILPVADEILVIDSGSKDKTQEIATKLPKVIFHHHPWEGFSGSKNFGNLRAQNDWILSVDADEALSPELQQSILIEKENDQEYAYRVSRLSSYCGTWIKHCKWYPDYKIRIFNRKSTQWVGESIHEKLVFNNNPAVNTLKGDLLHYTLETIGDSVDKINNYSTIWANEAFAKGKKKSGISIFIDPLKTFINIYFINGGILDGLYGFEISVISSYAKFLRIAKLKNLYKKHKKN